MTDAIDLDLITLPIQDQAQANIVEWVLQQESDDPPIPVYRIQERDNKTGPKPALAIGTEVTYKRIVIRVGYEFGIHSVTRREWTRAGMEIIAERTNLPLETIARVLSELALKSPMRGIRAAIYDKIIRPLTANGANRNVRAMWFHDFDRVHTGIVEKIKYQLTGHRDPGLAYSPGYDDDYEPPSLTDVRRQSLYVVRETQRYSTDDSRYYIGKTIDTFGCVLVYPDDASEVIK